MRVVILGAGPAGLAAAWLLRRTQRAEVVVLERADRVGGNAGSFDLDGIAVDYGSHRLHPACDPTILHDLQQLLGTDLLDRPRHGRIWLRGRWIHFPLKPLDLAIRLPPSFAGGVVQDALRKVVARDAPLTADTFAAVMERGLGRTICHDFYFPYARKVWGVSPDELSAVQARRRVGANSLAKMVRRVVGLRSGPATRTGRFYYPRRGYGQISEAMATAARALGSDIRLSVNVHTVERAAPHRVVIEHEGTRETLTADHVWSTIPITTLGSLLQPPVPGDVLAATTAITYRAMVLIYLILGQRQFSAFDAHYFPEADVPLTRLSEPKNYADRTEPADRTVLCGELPCTVGDRFWQASDEELGTLAQESLARCGLPIGAPVLRIVTKRLPYAYPIYHAGYEQPFAQLDRWVAGLDGILTLGRQGLFAHDNTHHTMAMAYAAVDCLRDTGVFDRDRWLQYRQTFETHVVED